jgi:Peptidase family M28/PDZ domain
MKGYYKLFVGALFLGLLFSCDTYDGLDEKYVSEKLKHHVEVLSSDELEGRETGQAGEKKAAEYIINEFSNIGLLPKGDNGEFTQSFEFLAGKSFEGKNSLMIGDQELIRDEDYFLMSYSGNGEVSGTLVSVGFGIQAPELGLDDYEGVENLQGNIALMDVSSPDGIHPHSKYAAYHDLRNRAQKALDLGAMAVIFINAGEMAEDPKRNYTRKMTSLDIPILFVSKNEQWTEGAEVTLSVTMDDLFNEGINVVGYVDNKASRTVIFGAHYDHLGYGDEGSLYRGENAEIHNGADDNASGTGMIIELARYFKNSGGTNNNYLLIAFSGEEKGLLGSNHFAKNPTIDLEKVNFMINLDMVGRLDSSSNLIATGVGTSPTWDSLVDGEIAGELNIEEKLDGIGPSDHTSFYLQDIPVLHFFTGAHSDYHKPTDDAELVNIKGMFTIYSYLIRLVNSLESEEMLAFTKTKDSENENAPRFSVTLGVVPDYAFSGKGMKIDGVTEGRPASTAGIEGGDIVIKIGDIDVLDMMAYMNALSNYKKGDSTNVIVNRSGEELEFGVRF